MTYTDKYDIVKSRGSHDGFQVMPLPTGKTVAISVVENLEEVAPVFKGGIMRISKKLFSVAVLAVTVVLSVIGFLFTGINYLVVLYILMCLDFITGMVKAFSNNTLNSEICFAGIVKKFYMVVIVSVCISFDYYLKTDLTNIILSFFCANEGLSIIENTGEYIPLPDWLKTKFIQIRGDKNENK